MIDIGGPAMLRAAAKNFAHVAPALPARAVRAVLAELREHGELAARDAAPARAPRRSPTTAALRGGDRALVRRARAFPATLTLAFDKVPDVAYGENPHQRGGLLRRARRAPARALAASSSSAASSSRSTT